MKVAIVYPYFAHYRAPIINLLSKENTIDYYFLGGRKPSPEFKDLKLIEIPHDNRFITLNTKWFFKYFSIQTNLLKELRREGFDAVIIYADWKFLSTWYAIIYLRLKQIPVLFWSHGFRKNKKSINDFIKEQYFKIFDGGFVFDQRAKDVFKSKNYKKRIDIVYNSLDYQKQLKVFEDVKSNTENGFLFKGIKPYVIFSGRLTETKNLDILLKAIKNLKDKSIYINILLIGDGLFKGKLENLALKLNIFDQVRFYGSCYDEKVLASSFINAISCVIPSAVGLSAVHALTYGCPVITDNNNIKHGPEVESVVEGFTGKYYEAGDVNSLANQINYFLELNSKERLSFKENAIETIKNKFNPEYQKNVFNHRINQLNNDSK